MGVPLLHAALLLVSQSPGPAVDFDRDVLPILSDHCFHCHGPDAGTREADLRLDLHDDVLFVAEPGEPENSELMDRVLHTNPKRLMPPPEFGKPLDSAQVDVLRRWIQEGVPWESHWAYAPPEAPALPELNLEVDGARWGNDPLDGLVAAGLSGHGLRPSPAAEPAVWLRRVTLDLTGLPPTVEELDALEKALEGASAGTAVELRTAAVDRLLASPRRAEHRTREWLDLARYADTNGYQNDFRRDQWPWRDWVLRAYRENKPYDRFVLEQVAGDLVPGATQETILATGFQRNHRTVTEAGSLDEEWRVENVADRTETTATAFLGITLACARCHDHKYDALTQADYYRFYGFFNSIDEKGVYQETRGNVPPLIRLHSEEELDRQQARMDEIRDERAEARTALEEAVSSSGARFEEWLKTPAATPSAVVETSERLTLGGEYALGSGQGPAGSLDLGSAITFGEMRPFTASLWVRPEGHGAVYSRMNDDDSYRGVDLVLLESMRPAVHLIHDWPERAIKIVGKEPLARDRWQHVAVTYDGSMKAAGVQVFVDGEPMEHDVETDSLEGSIASEAPLVLGFRRYAGDLAGRVADFAVHRAPLGPSDVRALAEVSARSEASGLPFYRSAFDPKTRSARAVLLGLTQEVDELLGAENVPTAMVLKDLEEPRVTQLLDRGRYDRPVGEPLRPDVPEVFGGLGDDVERNRLALGNWLISEDNPLTARVAVNRIWASFFGTGLVATPDDFGVRGDRPVYPELLDYLCVEFVESGWDVAALERRIALSATYGQSSAAAPELVERDPGNRLLARGPRHRLDAETIRDQALTAAGLLEHRFGGESVKPYQPEGLWKELAGGAGQGAYVPSTGDDLFRRSLYTYRKRTVPHPSLTTFDAPGFELCTVKRSRTNTPLQALAVMNDVAYVEASRHLARRMLGAGESPGDRLNHGARALLARSLTEAEQRVLLGALGRYGIEFAEDTAAASALLGVGATAPPAAERTSEWAAYTMVASTLMNLDEALIKR